MEIVFLIYYMFKSSIFILIDIYMLHCFLHSVDYNTLLETWASCFPHMSGNIPFFLKTSLFGVAGTTKDTLSQLNLSMVLSYSNIKTCVCMYQHHLMIVDLGIYTNLDFFCVQSVHAVQRTATAMVLIQSCPTQGQIKGHKGTPNLHFWLEVRGILQQWISSLLCLLLTSIPFPWSTFESLLPSACVWTWAAADIGSGVDAFIITRAKDGKYFL